MVGKIGTSPTLVFMHVEYSTNISLELYVQNSNEATVICDHSYFVKRKNHATMIRKVWIMLLLK